MFDKFLKIMFLALFFWYGFIILKFVNHLENQVYPFIPSKPRYQFHSFNMSGIPFPAVLDSYAGKVCWFASNEKESGWVCHVPFGN